LSIATSPTIEPAAGAGEKVISRRGRTANGGNHALGWPEVRFAQDVIEIKAAKSKTASRRLPPILPVLVEWLAPLRKDRGRVLVGVLDEFAIATQFKKAVDAITDGNGKPLVKIVHNGRRHSFITYHMAILKNAAEVALEAGNSPRMIFEHYRELATTAEPATKSCDKARTGLTGIRELMSGK
jgi:hypothetical protein